jgi:hypothetical protein
MRTAVHLVVILVAWLGAGCATSVEVSFDESQDFSRFRTWDWLPGARSVDALPGEERDLERLTASLVAAELREKGLVRSVSEPDLRIGYWLRVDRQLVHVNETGATALLASHHSSPSYLVQATEARVDVFDRGHLVVVITDGPRERRVWRGELWARRRGRFATHLPATVSNLLGRLPVEGPAPPAAR